MAQIIKHRRGSIGDVKSTTTRNGEVLIASGSISDLSGPFVFIGSPVSSDEGVAGAFKPTAKIYSGNQAPTIDSIAYGSILDGTPFYASSDESLYILNQSNVGNSKLDLTGNIEGNTITNVTVTSLTGSNLNVTNITGGTITTTGNHSVGVNLDVSGTIDVTGILTADNNVNIGGDLSLTGDADVLGDVSVTGDITGSNLLLTGDANITGDITLGGNINIGDSSADFVKFGADVSSSIKPDVDDSFDLGAPDQNWRNLHVSGTAYIDTLQASNISLDSISVINDLTVDGSVTLGDEASDTIVVNSGDIEMTAVPTGNTTTFIGLDVNDKLVKDTLDSRVLGNTLIDNNGTSLTTNRVTFALDGDSIQDKSTLTFNPTTDELSVASTTIGNDVSISNDLTVTSNTAIGGNLDTTGNLGVTGDATVAGDTVLGGNLDVSGDTTVVGTLNVDTDAIVSGELSVSGNTNLDGNLYVSGNLEVLGSATSVVIQSSTVEIDDNIIKLNAYSPFERYAGFEVMDSGSTGVSASLVWDSQADYWMFVSSSGDSSKLIGTTPGTYGSEVSLTNNVIPKGTSQNTIGDSLISDNGTIFTYNTNKFTVTASNGNTLIAGNVTLTSSGGTDGGNNTSSIMFKDSNNVLGYVSTSETTDVLDGILGYKSSDGALTFSTVIDGGTY